MHSLSLWWLQRLGSDPCHGAIVAEDLDHLYTFESHEDGAGNDHQNDDHDGHYLAEHVIKERTVVGIT